MLVIGIIIGFTLAQVITPPYQVSSSQMGFGSIKINCWTGQSWFLTYEGYQDNKPYWEEIRR